MLRVPASQEELPFANLVRLWTHPSSKRAKEAPLPPAPEPNPSSLHHEGEGLGEDLKGVEVVAQVGGRDGEAAGDDSSQ